MDCSKYQSQFTALSDGDLAPAERDSLQAHLKECLTCYRRWCSFQKMEQVLGQLPQLDSPEHLGALVMARVKDRGFRQRSWLSGSVPRWLTLGVGVAALCVITFSLWQTVPAPFSWKSQPDDSRSRGTTATTSSQQPAATFRAMQRSNGSDRPVMVLKVKDFSRVDQDLESVLRSFSRSIPQGRDPIRSIRSSSARLIDVQIAGQQFPHLIHELHKLGHLDDSQAESHKVARHNRDSAVSIRIVVVSNGADTETWLKARSKHQATESEERATGTGK